MKNQPTPKLISTKISDNKVMTIETFQCLSEQYSEYLGITVSVVDVAQMQKMRKLCTVKSIMDRQNLIYKEIETHLSNKDSVVSPPLVGLLDEVHKLAQRLKDEKSDMDTYKYIADNYDTYCDIKSKSQDLEKLKKS